GLVGFALLLTAAVRIGWLERSAVPSVERAEAAVAPLEQRSLRFADGADGSVLITEAATGERVGMIAAGSEQGGFIRGVMRGLARERRMYDVGSEPPFTLTLWQDGSMSLVDDATGRSVELGAFGPDNRAAFAVLLEGGDLT
ncbi:MAG: phosphonoacetaldehyde methylase, partial [Alphaproteobacteria bacterium]|nr:phosphonoacetaldehyde methylase [Alphaproteobacteria bacterium]